MAEDLSLLRFQEAPIDPWLRSTACNTPAIVVEVQGSIELAPAADRLMLLPCLVGRNKLHRDRAPVELEPVLDLVAIGLKLYRELYLLP